MIVRVKRRSALAGALSFALAASLSLAAVPTAALAATEQTASGPTALSEAAASAPDYEAFDPDFSATTYRVTVYAGNNGTVNGERACVFADVPAGEAVDLSSITVEVPSDGKYYAKGVRLAALDNVSSQRNSDTQEGVATVYYAHVAADGSLVPTAEGEQGIVEDTDLVVAYGVTANRVSYTVSYVDADGEELIEPQTFAGDIGDQVILAPRYVEGYVPRNTLFTFTLGADEGQNVVAFTYDRLEEGSSTTENPNGTVDVTAPDGTVAPGVYSTVVPTTPATTAPAAGATVTPAAGAAAPVTPAVAAEPLTTEAGTPIVDDTGTPLAEPTPETIEDDENALAGAEATADSEEAMAPAIAPWILGAVAVILAGLILLILARQRSKDRSKDACEEG